MSETRGPFAWGAWCVQPAHPIATPLVPVRGMQMQDRRQIGEVQQSIAITANEIVLATGDSHIHALVIDHVLQARRLQSNVVNKTN